MGASRWLGWAILLAYLGGIEWLWGWGRLLAPLSALPARSVGVTLILLGLTYMLRSLRLYDYFRPRMRGCFGACTRLTIYHNFWNVLLPARTGEVSFPLLLDRYFQIPWRHSLPTLLWFRLLDLHTLSTIGGMALAIMLLGSPRWWWSGLLLAWLLLPLAAWRALRYLRGYYKEAATRPWQRSLADWLHGLPDGLGPMLRSLGLTWLNWSVKLAVLAWLYRQFQAMPVDLAALAAVLGELSSVLPIHAPGGVGTYEAGAVGILVAHEIPLAAAVTAAVNVHLLLLGTALLSGALVWLSTLNTFSRPHAPHGDVGPSRRGDRLPNGTDAVDLSSPPGTWERESLSTLPLSVNREGRPSSGRAR